MKVGDKQTVTVPAQEAYGVHGRPPRSSRSRGMPCRREIEPPQEGMQLQARTPDGGQVALVVTALDDQRVTVDANHPLAGQDLVFEIEIVDIVKAA